MAKYRETTFKKYINEALSKDFTNSKTMFDQAVKNFKETKEINATSLNLLSDILRYISKFIEEQSIVSPLPELKKAKEAAREAMGLLDKAYEKMTLEDSSLPKKSKTNFDDDIPADKFDTPDDSDAEDQTDNVSNDKSDKLPSDDTSDDLEATPDATPKKKSFDPNKLPPMGNDDDIKA